MIRECYFAKERKERKRERKKEKRKEERREGRKEEGLLHPCHLLSPRYLYIQIHGF